MTTRNEKICKLYSDGATLEIIAGHYGISRQRVRQIVSKAGLRRSTTPRPAFVGVDVTKETKARLKAKADEQGTSMSKLASDAITSMLDESNEHEQEQPVSEPVPVGDDKR